MIRSAQYIFLGVCSEGFAGRLYRVHLECVELCVACLTGVTNGSFDAPHYRDKLIDPRLS